MQRSQIRSMKCEIRNKSQNPNRQIRNETSRGLEFAAIGVWNVVSNFGFRISDFVLQRRHASAAGIFVSGGIAWASRRERGATRYRAWRAGMVSRKLRGGG